MKLLSLAGACLFAVLSLFSGVMAHEYNAGALDIGHPWGRPTPPGLTIGVGYMTIRNSGTEGDRLIAAETPASAKVEIHTHLVEEGVMKMRQIDGIDLPAGAEVALAPGGLHLMLIDLAAPLKDGDLVPMTLTFEKAGKVEIVLMIEKRSSADAEKMEHNH